MSKVYLGVIQKGSYEDKETIVTYAGECIQEAIKQALMATYIDCIDLSKPNVRNGDVNFAWVETWEGGKKVKEESVYG